MIKIISKIYRNVYFVDLCFKNVCTKILVLYYYMLTHYTTIITVMVHEYTLSKGYYKNQN